MLLNELPLGHRAVILAIAGEGADRRHLLDLGLVPGSVVTMVRHAPMGDPVEIRLHGYQLSCRKSEAALVSVRPVSEADSTSFECSERNSVSFNIPHPGLGESGRYHDGDTKPPLSKEAPLTFAIAGQQNSGKTALFNILTGSKQRMGNLPGLTIERTDGTLLRHPNVSVVDLPGLYSLSPYGDEQLATCDFLIGGHPHCIINVVDAGHIERHLYLTLQLMELGVPMVLALNMMDEVYAAGGAIRVNLLEQMLGIPVVPISAVRKEGIDELVAHALHVARFCEPPLRRDFCDSLSHSGALHRCLHSIAHLVENHAASLGINARFAASKLVEGDASMSQRLSLSDSENDMVQHIVSQMEAERGLDRAAAMADMRYEFIDRCCRQAVVLPTDNPERRRTRRIDAVLTGRYTALPIFVSVILLVLWLSIDVIGAPLQEFLRRAIDALSLLCCDALGRAGASPVLLSLVSDAIFGGVGSVVSFIPIIAVLFFFLSLLEDTGYMSRVAFVTDRLLRHLGLTGHSIVPLLMGFGCTVPAVMASRALTSSRDRRMTVLLLPFMSCSAKIPVYAFLAAAFFPGRGGLVLAGLYLLGVLTGVVVALVARFLHRGEPASPFVMEMPNYRLPQLSSVLHLLWVKVKDFIQQACTVILAASIVIWFLQTFDFGFNTVVDGRGSMINAIAGSVAPLFAPIGLGAWQIVTALFCGLMAKESVVASLQVLGSLALLTPASAAALLVFCLLYTPCVAALAAVRRELGRRWAVYVVVFQCAIAYLMAGVTYWLWV